MSFRSAEPSTHGPRSGGAGRERPRAIAWAKVLGIAAIVIAADWFSKRAIESSIKPGEERKFLPGVQLVDTRNHGVAFGLLPDAQVYVTVALAVVVVAVLIYFVRRSGRGLIWLPTGMLIGGALGNIIDRLRDGAVTDFIKLPLGWPPFNLADTAITLGVIILVLLVGGAEYGGSEHASGEDRDDAPGTPDRSGAAPSARDAAPGAPDRPGSSLRAGAAPSAGDTASGAPDRPGSRLGEGAPPAARAGSAGLSTDNGTAGGSGQR